MCAKKMVQLKKITYDNNNCFFISLHLTINDTKIGKKIGNKNNK